MSELGLDALLPFLPLLAWWAVGYWMDGRKCRTSYDKVLRGKTRIS